MPKKPPRERKTDNALGQKLQQVMLEKGQDFKALAEQFGVSVPSVYDWIDHGRLSKDRYRRLVEWSGRSLDWWFDIELPASQTYPEPTPSVILAAETVVNYGPAWPFPAISPSAYYRDLTEFERGEIQGFARAIFLRRKQAGHANGTEG